MLKYLSNGGLSKTSSILYQFIIGLGCAFICGWQILHGEPINIYCAGIVAGILGSQITIHAGGVVSETSNKQTELAATIATNPQQLPSAKDILHGN